jgi:signal transduction histidine kinase
MISGACLALAIIQLRIWLTERVRRESIAFAAVCFSAAVFCLFERSAMLSATPAEALFYIRWCQLPGSLALISIAGLIYVNLHGRRWLFWTYCASRSLVLIVNFIIPNGINYREITALRNVSILGETISSPVVVPNPLMMLVQFSHVLLIIFCLDATLLARRRGNHGEAAFLGITFLVFGAVVLTFSIGVLWGFLPVPILISFSVLFIAGAIVEKLSVKWLKSGEFSEKLSGLVRYLLNKHESENARIAYELQEGFSQNLVLLAMRLNVLRRLVNPVHIENQLYDLESEVNNLSSDLNRISHELHPPKIKLLGLESALRRLCSEFTALYQVNVEFVPEDLTRNLPDDVSLCLYRVTEEALQNVAEHSGASTANVHLKLENNKVRLTISDNGKGFDLNTAGAADSFGLISIDQRIRAVNGIIKVETKPGFGTKIEAIVPVNQEIIPLAE